MQHIPGAMRLKDIENAISEKLPVRHHSFEKKKDIMKTVKYFLVGAMMTVISAPVMAQSDNPVVAQAAEIINSKAADADKQVKNLSKAVKKDAQALAAIGRAYLGVKNFEQADLYADLAIKANKNLAVGYVLKGDICVLKDDGGQASSWFEQANYFDPKDPEGYRRYAQINSKTDPAGSIAKLEQLRSIDPTYPVDLIAAEIQSRAGNADAAIGYYSKVSLDKMKNYELTDYSMLLFLKQKYDESLKVSSFGNDKFPRYASLNRLSMLNNVNLEKYEDALVYADRLFNASDSAKYSFLDYINYGTALQKLKKNDEAIAIFKKIVEDENIDAADKVSSYKNLSDVYKSMSDYDNAIAYYKKYIDGQQKVTANVKNGLALIYRSMALEDNITPEQKAEAVKNADEIFGQIADEFPNFAQSVTAQRAKLAFILDPEDKAGMAKPHYDKLIELISALPQKDDSDNRQLVEAYTYNMVYFLKIKDDIPTSKDFANKILAIDPANAMATQVAGLK